MNTLKNTTILGLFFLLLLNCAGGGTGSEIEGKSAITGKVVYENGKPVPGAVVRIRPAYFLALDSSATEFACDTVTDNKGMFYFNTVEADSYTIEINKSGDYGRIVSLVISADEEIPIVIPETKLKPTGSIQGRINLPITDDSLRPLMCIYGLDYLVKAEVTQDFNFKGIPAGTYNLRIIPCRVCNLILELQNIKVVSDSVSDVGMLNLSLPQFFKGCGSWECDSLVVRSLLDSNLHHDVDVHSVVRIDSVSGRVIGLLLNGMKISNLTKNIGSLSKLKRLDINNNQISRLPNEIGYLSSLAELYLDSNYLQILPNELSFCKSLTTLSARNNKLIEFAEGYSIPNIIRLDLSCNRLQSVSNIVTSMKSLRYFSIDSNEISVLPQSIVNLELLKFSCRNNQICSIPLMIDAWLSRFDSNWPVSQHCE